MDEREFHCRILGVEPDATLFGTGCRLGEAFAIRSFDGQSVFIDSQYARNPKTRVWEYRAPKNRVERWAWVVPELRPAVKRWVLRNDKENLRRTRFLDEAKKLWGVSVHDLRHSYAIHLASSGFGVSQIASQLGDGEQVVRDHYLGFLRLQRERALLDQLYSTGINPSAGTYGSCPSAPPASSSPCNLRDR